MKQWMIRSVFTSLACMFLFTIAAAAQGGELVAAEFGAGNRRVDVTPQVRAFIHDGVLRMDVEDGVFRVDPAYGHLKELFIRIRHWDGQTEEFHFPEHAHINLMLDPDAGYRFEGRDLHIMRAFYGAAGHFVDVTDTIRHYKRDGRVFVVVDNRSMGGDPDYQVPKVLRVLYWFQGQRRQLVVPEHGELRLP
jgi:hypothetical protein